MPLQNQVIDPNKRENPEEKLFDDEEFEKLMEKKRQLDELQKSFIAQETEQEQKIEKEASPEQKAENDKEEIVKSEAKEKEAKKETTQEEAKVSGSGASALASQITASQNHMVLAYVAKAIKSSGNKKVSVINKAKRVFGKDPRLLDEFHDALLEAEQLDAKI